MLRQQITRPDLLELLNKLPEVDNDQIEKFLVVLKESNLFDDLDMYQIVFNRFYFYITPDDLLPKVIDAYLLLKAAGLHQDEHIRRRVFDYPRATVTDDTQSYLAAFSLLRSSHLDRDAMVKKKILQSGGIEFAIEEARSIVDAYLVFERNQWISKENPDALPSDIKQIIIKSHYEYRALEAESIVCSFHLLQQFGLANDPILRESILNWHYRHRQAKAENIVNAISLLKDYDLDSDQEMKRMVIQAQDYSAVSVAQSFVQSSFSERNTTAQMKAFPPPKKTRDSDEVGEVYRPPNQARK